MENTCVLTVGVSLISAVVDGVSPRCPPVPFQVFRGGPFVFPRGHLFTVAGTLWALVLHVTSSIRLVACGPPLTGVGGRPGIIASQTLYYLNAFYHTSRAQLGPILAIYPLVLSAKKNSFFGVENKINVIISRSQRILNEALCLNCCQRTHGSWYSNVFLVSRLLF